MNAWNIGKATLKLIDPNEAAALGFAADKIGAMSFLATGVNAGKVIALKNLDTAADLADANKNPAGVTFPLAAFSLRLL